VELKVWGKGSAPLTVFNVYSVDNNGNCTLIGASVSHFAPTTAGIYMVEAVSPTETLQIGKYVAVQ